MTKAMKNTMYRFLLTLFLMGYVALFRVEANQEIYYQGVWYSVTSSASSTHTGKVMTREANFNNEYKGNDVSGDIVIPEIIRDWNYYAYKVEGIGPGSFAGCSGLTSISLPNSITYIGESAFFECGLLEINIPESVTDIYKSAFERCTNLSQVSMPQQLTSIPDYLFRKCSSLRNIAIPETVTSIGSYAFSQSGLESIVIPNSVTSIGTQAFANCQNLLNVKLSESITIIIFDLFKQCTKLQKIEIPSSVEVIRSAAFNGCVSLSEVKIPNTVWKIEKGAFWGCSALEHIDIPESVTTIEWNTFRNTGLRSIVIPSNIISIGDNAFYNDNLMDVTYLTENPITTNSADTYFSDATYNNGTLHYLDGYKDVYLSRRPWYYFKNFDMVTSVENIEFEDSGNKLPDVYNLNGTCLIHNASESDIDTLPHGIYIIGGRKVQK